MNKRSKQVRRDAIKLSKANGGYHWGGSFSCAEILISLYDEVLTDDDVFILSKGHGCWCYYVLLREKGFNPVLEGHPSYDPVNGVHATTGSMGHGFPFGIGIALAKKMKGEPGKVYVLMGDGECQEGTTWESLLLAVKLDLKNLVVIIDNNKIQGSGFTDDINSIQSIYKVAENIGWETFGIDGQTYMFEFLPRQSKQPIFIIANTVKGKGVSFMENKPEWHSKWLTDEMEQKALKELCE
jgi:transketolase